jgi:hypothetical protein
MTVDMGLVEMVFEFVLIIKVLRAIFAIWMVEDDISILIEIALL